MKRVLVLVIPLFLLVLLNACDTGRLPPLSQRQLEAIQATLQVTAMPQSQRIQNLMNNRLNIGRLDQLEESLVGKYEVIGVDFPYGTYFQVNMNCQCADGSSNCCDPERMFFITLQRMSQARDQILADVPATVQNLDVVCYDHNLAFAVVIAPWDKVKEFLNGVISAADLSTSVSPPRAMP